MQERKLTENYQDADYIQDGANAVGAGKPIVRWQERRKRDKSDKEEWAEDGVDVLD